MKVTRGWEVNVMMSDMAPIHPSIHVSMHVDVNTASCSLSSLQIYMDSWWNVAGSRLSSCFIFFSGDQTERSRCCDSQCLSSPCSLILYVMSTPLAYRHGSNNSQCWLKPLASTGNKTHAFCFDRCMVSYIDHLYFAIASPNRGAVSVSPLSAASSLMNHKTVQMGLIFTKNVRSFISL